MAQTDCSCLQVSGHNTPCQGTAPLGCARGGNRTHLWGSGRGALMSTVLLQEPNKNKKMSRHQCNSLTELEFLWKVPEWKYIQSRSSPTFPISPTSLTCGCYFKWQHWCKQPRRVVLSIIIMEENINMTTTKREKINILAASWSVPSYRKNINTLNMVWNKIVIKIGLFSLVWYFTDEKGQWGKLLDLPNTTSPVILCRNIPLCGQVL